MTKKILVVDDEPDSLRLLTYFLRREGYEITVAKDGLDAMELLLQSRFDLVLSDLTMPRMNGIALATHIRYNLSDTPIFLMTGYGCDDERILALGVPCLSKPLALNQLLSEVQKVLGNGRQL